MYIIHKYIKMMMITLRMEMKLAKKARIKSKDEDG